MKKAIPICFLLALLVGAADAAPSNDHFADRIISSAPSVSYEISDLQTASVEGGERLEYYDAQFQYSVWYQWTAPDDGIVRIDTTNTQYAVSVSVWHGSSLANLRYIDRNDGGYAIELPVTQGSEYIIRYGGKSVSPDMPTPGQKGHLHINLRTDTPFNGVPLHRPSTVNNDMFANRIVIFGNLINVIAYNHDATREGGEPDATEAKTLWYEWTAPAAGYLTRNLLYGEWTRLHFWTGTQIHQLTSKGYVQGGTGNGGAISVDAGQTYLISLATVSGRSNFIKAFSLSFSPATAPPPSTVTDRYYPSVSITGTSPKSGKRLPSNRKITIKGAASDDLWLSSWQYNVNGRGSWKRGGNLSGKYRTFSKKVGGVKAGRNIIYVRAIDRSGKYSTTAYRYVNLKKRRR